MRLIDADRLIERLRNAAAFYGHETAGDFDTGRKLGLIEAKEKVAEEPTIEVEPVKHGRWIPTEYDSYADGAPVWDKWECSECSHEHSGEEDTLTSFCPNCGAKMDGD